MKSNHTLAHVHPGSAPGSLDMLHQAIECDGVAVCLSVNAATGVPRLTEVVNATDQMHELLNPLAVFDRIERAMAELAESDERYA